MRQDTVDGRNSREAVMDRRNKGSHELWTVGVYKRARKQAKGKKNTRKEVPGWKGGIDFGPASRRVRKKLECG